MARIQNTLMEGLSFNADRAKFAKQADISIGAQYGYQPDAEAYVNNAGYRPQRLISLLVEPPRGFSFLNNPEKTTQVLRQLMEQQSKTINGIRSGLNVEYSERALDGAGRMQRDPTNVTEEISNPAHTWDERYGRSIHTFWMWYIRMLIGDPVTKQPGIMNLSDNVPTDHLPDIYSFTMLYIQPDPLRRRVEEAWLQIGMSPNTSGVLESQYDVTAAADVPEISIEFGGVPFSTLGVLDFAQTVLDKINYVNAGPLARPAFLDKISADVLAGNKGYTEDIATANASGIAAG